VYIPLGNPGLDRRHLFQMSTACDTSLLSLDAIGKDFGLSRRGARVLVASWVQVLCSFCLEMRERMG